MIIDPFKDRRQFLDIVAKVQEKETGNEIIIHVEPQSYRERDFTERMFRYANMLYNRLKLPMINIALFSFREAWQENQFTLNALTYESYTFNYQSIHLKSLHWKKFKDQPNPISATLMCLMQHADGDRVDLKVTFYRMLVKTGIGLEQGRFLLRFFDQYLPYTEEGNEKVKERLKQEPETFDIENLPIQIEEIARKEGQVLGSQRERERIALNMLKDDLPISTIAKYVNMSVERIKQLKNNG